MSDPRICIIGAGGLSSRRIYPYIGAVGAQLVGVCDLDREKAERNARRFGGRVYADWKRMLEQESPDGVIICIGAEAHAALAPEVMRHGFPVYTEKPPAPSAPAALDVARVSKETGLLCMTAFKKRYCVAYSRAKEWIETFPGEDLYSLSIDYGSRQYPNTSDKDSFLLDFGIHGIDLVGYLFGAVERVFAFAKGRDAYAVSLQFANGAVGSLNLNDGRSYQAPTEEVEISIRGGNCMTISNSSRWRLTENGQPSEWREPPTFISRGDSGDETGHRAEIADFVAAILEGRTTRSNIYESYKSMLLYEAILESAQTNKTINLEFAALLPSWGTITMLTPGHHKS